jgi:RNA polymerase sigma-70 factor (ECF subfamily)
MPEETEENKELLRLSAAGDGESWQALVDRSRHRLRRIFAFRLDRRLCSRVDPSDVLQDSDLQAWRDLGSYLDRPEIPFFFRLRGMVGNTLRDLHRRHLGTRMCDPCRDVLAPRHFEQLPRVATARVLGIREKAAGMRYVRAPRRLKEIPSSLGGDWLEP